MVKGYLAIILHAHLPFVRHPGNKDELAEDWLYEAITECYLPLIKMMHRLINKGIDFRLTIDISPSLASMLNDELLQKKYKEHLLKLIELSEKEINRTNQQAEFNKLARLYNSLFQEAYFLFQQKYHSKLLQAFKELQDMGKIEIITSAATHGYLPLIYTKEAINAQIETGIKTYCKFFDKKPKGIWLPECGFKPELDPILADNNIRFFISSTHGILYAIPRPRYGVYAPIYTPNGVAAFGRDVESSKQVWSADDGYPGDYNYREFYRDIAYDLDYDYLKEYLPAGIRKDLGFKYYKITGKNDLKQPYIPTKARKKAAEHAGNFLFNRQQQIKYLNQILDRKPIIVAPYDAELFGHWWFEGPQWLEFLLEKIYYDQDEIKTITLSEYLELYPKNQVAMPAESSWGYKGYHEIWLNETNDWIYRHLQEAEVKMISLTSKFQYLKDHQDINYRALNQLSRELLLAQSSDWAFIMKTKTMVNYAVFRTKKHLHNFFELAGQIENRQIRESFLNNLENQNNIFPFADFKIYRTKERIKALLQKEG